MKTLTSSIILSLTITSMMSQITLEHSYTLHQGAILDDNYYGLFKFSGIGEKYVFDKLTNDGKDSVLNLYNLNHSLYKTISLPPAPTGLGKGYLFIISDNLFDSDADLEYMMSYYDPNTDVQKVMIYEEDGSVLLSIDSVDLLWYYSSTLVYPYLNQTFLQTSDGTKMALVVGAGVGSNSPRVSIYSLPGEYLVPLEVSNVNDNPFYLSTPIPNPTGGITTIRYELPQGIIEGEIVVYNLSGQEQKRYKVDKTSNSLLLDNTELPSGNYLYNLVTAGNRSGAKKMIVIK